MTNNNNIQIEIQAELNDEIISPFKEISYEDFLKSKNRNKKCCSFCCIFKICNKRYEIDLIPFYNDTKKLCYKNVFINNIVYSITNFIFIIPVLFFCFYLMPEFEKFKEKENGLRLLESTDEWFDQGFDLKYANIQPKYKLWYNLFISEIIFLFFNFIFDILIIIFLFSQCCKNKIIIEKKNKHKKNILKNFIIFLLISIFIYNEFYYFLFNVFVIDSYSFDKKNDSLGVIKALKLIFLILIVLSSFSNFIGFNDILCFYMDLNFKERLNKTKNNENDEIKTGYLFINNKNIEVSIKTNKNLYLEENNQNQNNNHDNQNNHDNPNNHDNKVYEFKQIKSNEITADFEVYIKIKNDAYQNMLAIADWRYGLKSKPEKIYRKYYKLLINFGLLIILLTPPLFLHANHDKFYIQLRKIIKNNIYKNYGNFEITFTIIRIIVYIIIFLSLLLLMFKRIFYGGYMIYKLLNYSNIICFSVIIYNVIVFIMNILLIILSEKCNSIQSDFIKKNNINDNFTKIFGVHFAFSFISLFDIIYIIYKINKFRKYLVKLKNDLDNIYKTENEKTENEFKFTFSAFSASTMESVDPVYFG